AEDGIRVFHVTGVQTCALPISIICTPYTARIIRSRVLGLATRTYVRAARVAGMSAWKTLRVHILPHTLPLAVVQCVLLSAGAMQIGRASCRERDEDSDVTG